MADPASLPPVTRVSPSTPAPAVTFGTIARTLFVRYRRRAVLGLVLIAAQALLLQRHVVHLPARSPDFYGVPDRPDGRLYVLGMAAANLLGPLLLGHLFDTVGRRRMISATYALAVAVLVGHGGRSSCTDT